MNPRKYPGLILNRTTGELEQDEVTVNEQSDSSLAGFGKPVDLGAAKKIVNEYINDPTNTNDQKTIAITLGRESLLHILSQENCEGVRFYLCKVPRDLANPNETHISILAVGVKKNINVVGIPMDPDNLNNQVQDLGTTPDNPTILADDAEEGFIMFEVGPPTKHGDIDKDSFLANEFFTQSLSKFL